MRVSLFGISEKKKNIRPTICCLKQTIEIVEQCGKSVSNQRRSGVFIGNSGRRSGVFIINFKQIPHIVLVFPESILNKKMTAK